MAAFCSLFLQRSCDWSCDLSFQSCDCPSQGHVITSLITVISFCSFIKPEILEELVCLVITEPDEDFDEKLRYK